jgi:hypothetical protein
MSRHCVQSVVRSNNEDAVCTRDITAQNSAHGKPAQ